MARAAGGHSHHEDFGTLKNTNRPKDFLPYNRVEQEVLCILQFSEAEGIEYEEEGCCGGAPYVRRLTMRQFWLSSPKLRYIFPPSSLCIR